MIIHHETLVYDLFLDRIHTRHYFCRVRIKLFIQPCLKCFNFRPWHKRGIRYTFLNNYIYTNQHVVYI